MKGKDMTKLTKITLAMIASLSLLGTAYAGEVTVTGNAEAKQALRDRKCVAWVYDDSSIGSDLSSGNWDEFEMPLSSEDDNPWGLGVPLAENSCVFGNFMSGMQYNWHRSGALIELEAKWGIKPTAYLKMQNERHGDWIK